MAIEKKQNIVSENLTWPAERCFCQHSIHLNNVLSCKIYENKPCKEIGHKPAIMGFMEPN